MSAPDTVDATRNRRWILPYRSIVEKLVNKGRVRVILSGEGEATDLIFWAQTRGFRVVRHIRTAVGMEVVLEAPSRRAEEAAAAAAPRREEARAARPTPPQAPRAAARAVAAQASSGGERRVEAPATAGSLDAVSARMSDPLFRVDLLLAGTSSRAGELKAPTTLDALLRVASEASGRGCAHLEASHSRGGKLELLACGGRLEGIILYTPDGSRLEGSKAVREAPKLLEREGSLEYRVTVVGSEFVEKLKS